MKVHNPRLTVLALDAIKKARMYILQVLDGKRIRALTVVHMQHTAIQPLLVAVHLLLNNEGYHI